MAGSASQVWQANQLVNDTDMNGLETNIFVTHDQNIGNPRTSSFDMDANELILDADQDTTITSDTDDRIDLKLGGVDVFRFDGATASVVNGYDFIGTIAGVPPTITMVGADTDVSLNIVPKGAGTLQVSGVTIGEYGDVVLAGQVFGG